ncbi:CRP/FNR family transcriptional regulator, anaerobic regulatory protein [Draconibacterium orientale]|jgi:CRP/FNR family transcriptional regulator|uniref:CRP/FNR family transcriptional regulator, anaerobic regulatory protein n=1 Tax=Draconibacterium orientale TaxID=1168034 RepID=A0A1I0ASV9_9BACT|nr:Crp/Fnr family transcriptional regulator [Draconibacterium orientale]SES97496.1 CRP/FNR family transcriptional regulator, anaerobic regulatory protein [Draconibacterium orientale]
MEDFYNQYNFLEPELQEEILKVGIRKQFSQHETLIREGQFISSFPMVLKGLIRVSRTSEAGNELLLYYLQANEVCAMSLTCCMARQISEVNAIAEVDTEVLLIPVEMLDTWTSKYPLWKQYVMQTFQNRFRELINTLDAVAFLKLDERLVKFFIDRHKKSGVHTYSGTHQDLALQLNSSREVISRLLKKLEKNGKVSLSRNFIDFSGLL